MSKSKSAKINLDQRNGWIAQMVFLAILALGIGFTALSVWGDIDEAKANVATSWLPFGLLALALLIALGFEFVNGFHDTANAVATVIYTHSLPPQFAVLWSGCFNFLGVLVSSGTVAFGIISLLPVELILQVGSKSGFAMVFALLIAAILWNLGTWWLGLPASSSHTMIGSIIGVGMANSLMSGHDGTSGVDWLQAVKVGYSLLLSPLIGFSFAALLFLGLRILVRNPALYQEPKGAKPPPWWVRGLLILTCTGVSFAHGSNDGQKGMGLIMLILVGTVPLAYALNRSMPSGEVTQFVAVSHVTSESLLKGTAMPPVEQADPALTAYIRDKQFNASIPGVLAAKVQHIAAQVKEHSTLSGLPNASVPNVRNDMYLVSEAIALLKKDPGAHLEKDTVANLEALKKLTDQATKFIPIWVKIAVAIALGLGTMVGWKRIVVTVGEKIGKTHLTYGQGASAELIAMLTIGAADVFGLPVSTTHVLSSGVAGTMAANQSGLQMATLRNLAMAWVMTLPAAMALSGGLFWLFSRLF